MLYETSPKQWIYETDKCKQGGYTTIIGNELLPGKYWTVKWYPTIQLANEYLTTKAINNCAISKVHIR